MSGFKKCKSLDTIHFEMQDDYFLGKSYLDHGPTNGTMVMMEKLLLLVF